MSALQGTLTQAGPGLKSWYGGFVVGFFLGFRWVRLIVRMLREKRRYVVRDVVRYDPFSRDETRGIHPLMPQAVRYVTAGGRSPTGSWYIHAMYIDSYGVECHWAERRLCLVLVSSVLVAKVLR